MNTNSVFNAIKAQVRTAKMRLQNPLSNCVIVDYHITKPEFEKSCFIVNIILQGYKKGIY